MTNALHLQQFWEKTYESPSTQFDREQPDEWIADIEARGGIRGQVLDAGCGPGRTALYLGSLGYDVLGVDLSVGAITRARHKAAAQNNPAQFLQADLCGLTGHDERFDTIVDIGCFHSLLPEDRAAYAAALHRASRPGSVIYLRAFSETNLKRANFPPEKHLPAVKDDDIRQAFALQRWALWDLEERLVRVPVAGGRVIKVHCWFAEIYYL